MSRIGMSLCWSLVFSVLMLAPGRAEETPAVELEDKPLSVEETIRQGFGIGLMVGEPTGLSAKKWLSETTALTSAAAWFFSGNDSFQLHADYLWHNFDLIKLEEFKGRFAVYYGVGARIKWKEDDSGKGRDDDRTTAGIRVPAGLSYLFSEVPLDLFAEIVPVLDIAPDTDFDIGVALGARYYFR